MELASKQATWYVNKKMLLYRQNLLHFLAYFFSILSFLYNIEFYPQHDLQFTYNAHVYTLVISPVSKISV